MKLHVDEIEARPAIEGPEPRKTVPPASEADGKKPENPALSSTDREKLVFP
jgi:hypothetical protein